MAEINLKTASTAALAYLGDCVFELRVRRALVEAGISSAKHLNSAALSFVRAPAQAKAAKLILPLLTEEEEAFFKRGRNIGHTNVPKSSTVAEYRMATGFEVLMAYLHVVGNNERIDELFLTGFARELEALVKTE